MKEDEQTLFLALQAEHKRKQEVGEYANPREVVEKLGMNEKRATFIFEKWADKDWYEWGVNVMGGWLTQEGLAKNPNEVGI